MTTDENIRLAKKLMAENIYQSICIEGIGMTFPETQTILSGMSVAGHSIDDINAVNDLKKAWHYILNESHIKNEFVTVSELRKINQILGKCTVLNAGRIRGLFDDPIRIGGTSWIPEVPPKEEKIDQMMQCLQKNPDIYDATLDLFCYCVRGQFFADGNKRTATLAANLYLIRHGGGIFFLPAEQKLEFYKKLIAYYESGDSEELKLFLENCMIKSYTKTLGQRFQLLREKEGLTRQQAAEVFHITQERLFALEMDAELPKMEELQRIANHFNLDIGILAENTPLEVLDKEETEDIEVDC